MAYIITKTDGTTLVTVPDTETNTDYGITLVGRNYAGYGVFINDNFVSLLENFKKATAPAPALEGQLWYNPTTKTISLWDSVLWKPLASVVVQSSAPDISGRKIGDIWWDTTEYQMNVWTGQQTYARTIAATATNTKFITLNSVTDLAIGDIVSYVGAGIFEVTIVQVYTATTQIQVSSELSVINGNPINITRGRGWFLVGPNYKRSQGITGVIPSVITDDINIGHTVALVLNDGVLDAIFSTDPEFTPNPGENVPGFATIKPGLQLKGSALVQISKTSLTRSVGAAGRTEIQLLNNTDILPGDLIESALVSLSSAIAVTDVFANNAVLISTATTVEEDETLTFQRGSGIVGLFHGTATNAQRIGGLAPDNFARLVGTNVFRGNVDLLGVTRIGADRNLVIDAPPGAGDVTISNPISGGALTFFTTITTPYNRTVTTTSTQTLINGIFCGVASVADILVGDIVTTSSITVGDDVRVLAKFIGNSAIQLSKAASISTNQVINFYSTRIRALQIEGSQGRVSVAAPPVESLDVANKLYVDGQITLETSARNSRINTLIGTAPVGRRTLGEISDDIDLINTGLTSVTEDNALKAYINNPTFTGVPRVPTAATGTDTTQIASTEYVNNEIEFVLTGVNQSIDGLNVALGGYAPLTNPAFVGSPTAPTALQGTNTQVLATTEFVQTEIGTYDVIVDTALNLKAPLASPNLTGTPLAPNAAVGTNTRQIATTAFVTGAIGDLQTILNDSVNGKAPIVSARLTGDPQAPTAPPTTSNAMIATTSFVAGAISDLQAILNDSVNGKAPIVSPNFTGVPSMSSSPALSDYTKNIPTTEWTKDVIVASTVSRWQGSFRTISTNPPTGGVDGDFWFQI